MTTYIHLPESQCYYPVGTYIADNIAYINNAAVILKDYLDAEEIEYKKVNLVCTGSSGAIISAIIATHLPGCRINHIKKEGENSHSSSQWVDPNNTIIFIDDFMDSGETYKRVYDKLEFTHGVKLNIALFLGNVLEVIMKEYPVDVVFYGTLVKEYV